jgi:parvulin-like peptidyl-prolyl isomerase
MRSITRGGLAVLVGLAAVLTATAQPPAGAPPAGAPPAGPGTPPPTIPSSPTPVSTERPTGVAATVNGQQIPEVAVWRALRQFPKNEHEMARKEILNHLVENALIDQYLNALKIAIEPAEVDKLLAELKGELAKAKKDYAKELESMMLTEAEFRAEVSAQMKWDKFLKQQGTDQALKAFFDKRPDIFDGTLVRARHILLTPGSDAAKAAQAKQQLASIKATILKSAQEAANATQGDNLAKEQARQKKVEELFAAYAKQNSVCPSKENGGDLQFFPRVGAMVEPFAEAAFRLNLFDVSDVVETEFGMHLILCTAKNPGKTRKFEEVIEDVRSVYAMQLRQAVVAQMKPKAQIAVNSAPAQTSDTPMGIPK